MSHATPMSLITVPLAIYFGVLGLLHSGSRPRLVAGPLDAALLAGGLGGIIAFGPVGHLIVGKILGGSTMVAWTTWGAIVAVGTAIAMTSASRRVAIYNIRPEELHRLARQAFGSLQGGACPTIDGVEDEAREHGIAIRSSRLLRAGVVEARGRNPEALILALRPSLVALLRRAEAGRSAMAQAMFLLAALIFLAPWITDAIARWK
ncbi:hypothetical protein TA3x_003230 [Tundrisphaera sp. TA3]|uniref:hypothetical protein n=1 Tax=Tundrisphaera sp. TA3 TaxID=3435775 RepID=UPI003EB8637F